MRIKIINYLKSNNFILRIFYTIMNLFLRFISLFYRIKPKQILFSSFGGRKFDDSPKALYDEICKRKEFDDYKLVWAFVDVDQYDIQRGEKIKIDTFQFFKTLVSSKIWISNSGMDRDIGYNRKGIIKIETWHGTPLKKICSDENSKKQLKVKKTKFDNKTIRCAQSNFDRDIFARLFNCSKDSFIICDLPRNDALLKYNADDAIKIKEKLNIDQTKKVILYTPTYREYNMNEDNMNFFVPPINLEKWKKILGKDYVFLIRAHYAVNEALNIKDDGFVYNVSNYPCLNDLYYIADIMISDYSSTFFDYSILSRPMFCFAYDLKEYTEKRGLYLDIEKELPCNHIDYDEDSLINNILKMNYDNMVRLSREFNKKYAPNAGNASKTIIDFLIKRIQEVK